MRACQNPCAECPFRKASVRGWLGPWTADDLVRFITGESAFVCHLTAGQPAHRHRLCAGWLRSALKSCKMFRDPELKLAQDRQRGFKRDEILDRFEFVEHHNIEFRRAP